MTELGRFSFLLHDDRAPATCRYFLKLATDNALADTYIFRILTANNQALNDDPPISVLQIGPRQTFSAPRHTIAHEPTGRTGLAHRKWTVSAARFDPGELYASFFVCMRDEPELDEGGNRQPDGLGFAAFGEVTSGFDVLEAIFERAEENEILLSPIPVRHVSIGEICEADNDER